MIHFVLGIFFIIKGLQKMGKTSYYYLYKDNLEVIPLEIIEVRQGSYHNGMISYHYIYQYDWHNKKRYYKTSTR